jgi:hypothetical protein
MARGRAEKAVRFADEPSSPSAPARARKLGAAMIPPWILWSTVGAVASKLLPDEMFPSLGKKPAAPALRARAVAGTRAAPREAALPVPPVQAEPALEPGYVPMDPSLPMDPWIDPDTEQGVLAALEWEDDRQLDGFAQSISHEGDPFGYGYYPQAASYLRYRAKIIREARQALATLEAEQAQKERIARGVVGASPARPHTAGASAHTGLPAGDTVGTAAPTAQAPPPSLEAVPAVRVKIKKSPAGRSPGARGGEGAQEASSNGATLPSSAHASPTEPPPSLEGAE